MSDLSDLARDLDAAAAAAPVQAAAVVAKGAVNVKQDWQRAWAGLSHLKHLADAVSYDITETPGTVEAQIGPDKDRKQGALGNVAEYGTANNAPFPGGGPALAAEDPRFTAAMDAVADRLL